MPKPVAAVRFEGTIAENADPDLLDFGSLKPGALDKVKKLHDTHSILVVSATVKYPRGVKLLYLWLIEHLVDFTDVWCGEGLPSADLWVDDNAVKL